MSEERFHRLEARVNALETRSAVDDVHRSNVETRLGSIEDSLKWLVRLIMGAFVTGVITYVLRAGIIGG